MAKWPLGFAGSISPDKNVQTKVKNHDINLLARRSDLKTHRLHETAPERRVGPTPPGVLLLTVHVMTTTTTTTPPDDHIYNCLNFFVSQPIVFKLGHNIGMTWAGGMGGLKFS